MNGISVLLVPRLAQVNPADDRRFRPFNSLLVAQPLQRFANVRQMIGSHIVHEHSHDFVISQAPMQPSEEHYELYN